MEFKRCIEFENPLFVLDTAGKNVGFSVRYFFVEARKVNAEIKGGMGVLPQFR